MNKRILLAWCCLILFSVACSSAGSLATATVSPAATPVPIATLTSSLSPTASQPATTTVKIFLIALEDQGRAGQLIGCGDSVLPVDVVIPPTPRVLAAALDALLAVRQQDYGASGLYNALYQSSLTLDQVTLDNRRAVVHLSGTLLLGGVCDNPRVKAQLEQTALQFPTVDEVAIFLNGKPLDEVLAER